MHYFWHQFMAGKRNHISFVQAGSAICMILALLWLTVSAPFVYAASQAKAQQHTMNNAGSPLAGNEEETTNPLGSSTEEKAPASSFSEEYLHDHSKTENLFSSNLQHDPSQNAGTYIAFHGELDVPPPDAA
jgi:hypothetical protein